MCPFTPVCSQNRSYNIVSEHFPRCCRYVAARWCKAPVVTATPQKRRFGPRSCCSWWAQKSDGNAVIYLDRAGHCGNNLVELTNALLHAAIQRSARCARPRTHAAEQSGSRAHSYNTDSCNTNAFNVNRWDAASVAKMGRQKWSEAVDAGANPKGHGFGPPPPPQQW